MKRAFGFAAALLLLTAPAFADDQGCHLTRVAAVDMTVDSTGRIDLPLQVAGQTLTLLVDTGGVNSMLTPEAVQSLGLHAEIFDNVRVTGFGGDRIDHYVIARDINFGGLHAPEMKLLVMPEGRLRPDVQGILGPDILRAYDDDFDFAKAKFNLFQHARCSGNLVYWTNDEHSEIPFDIDRGGHIQFSVEIDGKKVRAVLDTGASGSVMSFETAESLFGFDEKDPALRAMPNGRRYKYPFKTMTFGGVTVNNPDLSLVPDDVRCQPGSQPALLGIGILRQLHMFISYGEEKIVVTAAGAH